MPYVSRYASSRRPDGECEGATEFVHSAYVLAWLESRKKEKCVQTSDPRDEESKGTVVSK